MAKHKRYLYIPLLLVALAWAGQGHAQVAPTDTTSEIWMTEAELESLLTRIALGRKRQLEEQKQAGLAPRAAAIAWQGQTAWNSQADDNAALQGQIDALNRQISTLSAALQSERRANGNTHDIQIANVQRAIDALNSALARQQYQSAVAQPPIIIQGGQTAGHQPLPVQPIIVQQPGNQAPARATESALVATTAQAAQASAADSMLLAQRLHASTQLNFQLQGQVDQLYEQLYGNQDDSVTADAALQATIDALAKEVDQLREQALAATPEPETEEIPESDVRHPAIDLYRHSIYFANNSTSISDADIDALRQLREQISKASSPTKVVLRGFSSTTGNAHYNVRLSSQRADAVKDVLIQLGLPATDIVTLYHGPDDSKRADLARRVEVTLSAD